MELVAFVISAVILINHSLVILAILLGRDLTCPIPIIYKWKATYANCHFSTPAMTYQVYFWTVQWGIIG